MKEKWNERYSISEYVYGEEPNEFFKNFINTIGVGKILLPAEGEGRNGVYAATIGWQVDAFDQSDTAKTKAKTLAQNKNVDIDYQTIGIEDVINIYKSSDYDLIALIFAHMPQKTRRQYLPQLISLLKTGGYIILEGFSSKQLNYQKENPKAGGPPEIEMLYTKDEIALLFEELNVISLSEEEISLKEGLGHIGKGSVIRFIGQKK